MVESELRERLRQRFDTTLPRFDVLAALYRNEAGLKMSALSNELRVSNGNVTGIVDRLVSDGMIVRVPVDSDRRAMVVRLTGAGRAHFEARAAAHEGWVSELLAPLGFEQAGKLVNLLEPITRHASERREDTE